MCSALFPIAHERGQCRLRLFGHGPRYLYVRQIDMTRDRKIYAMIFAVSITLGCVLDYSFAAIDRGMKIRGMVPMNLVEMGFHLKDFHGFIAISILTSGICCYIQFCYKMYGLALTGATWLFIVTLCLVAISLNLIPIQHLGHYE